MSNYYEVFQQRCYNRGLGFKNRVQEQVAHNFQRFLKSSPNAVEVKINNQGDPVRVATISDRDTDTLFQRHFLCDKSDGIKVGDFLYWDDSIWLVFKKDIDTIQAYDKFECILCRHKVRWIDSLGILRETPCYLVAQTDEKIKANFRTWNNMITPQPNKFIEIIMPYQYIRKNTEIIVFDEAWRLGDYDKVSVPGVIYMSFTETKVNDLTDDLREQLANADKKQIWKINAPNELYLSVGDTLKIDYTISKDGLILTNNNISPQIMPG